MGISIQPQATMARAVAPRICIHCGNLVPEGFSSDFCCVGCSIVYEVISSTGLSEFYKIKDAGESVCLVPGKASSKSFDYLDQPDFIKQMNSPEVLEFYLEGLNCTACLWLLEKLPRFCSDAVSARVNLARSTVKVYKSETGRFSQIASTLDRFGYNPHPLTSEQDYSSLQKREWQRDLMRVGVAGAMTGNIMIYAVANYAGADGLISSQFKWITAILAIPVLSYCAWPFYKSAWSALRNRHLNLEVPIVAALIAGIVMSVWSLSESKFDVYFDSLCMLVFLLLSSRLWLKSVQAKFADTVGLENELFLRPVDRVRSLGLEQVSPNRLEIGDVVVIRGEMRIPADGEVTEGSGYIDASAMTGESRLVPVLKGHKVEAGSLNTSGEWSLKVEKTLAYSRISEILKSAQAAQVQKPRISELAEKTSRWFISIVFLLSAAIIIYFGFAQAHEGLARALALVIVTCPCVFGMAVPLTLSLAIRECARQGIIVSDSNALERLWKIKTIYFDKTGTLTTGVLKVLNSEQIGNEHLTIAYGLEAGQTHPVARAIAHLFFERGLSRVPQSQSVSLRVGGGVQGSINGKLFEIRPIEGAKGFHEDISMAFGLFENGQLLTEFQMGDSLRADIPPMVSRLSKNYSVRILSGDKESIVADCAKRSGISEFFAEATPEQKFSIIANDPNPQLMVGDGVNDTAALAKATVGVAVRGELGISLQSADIYMFQSGIKGIGPLLEIAKSTRFVILRNLLFASVFNVTAGAIAITGYMSPLWAALLMPLSSTTVLVSSMAMRRGSKWK